ncbi:hypothetical protein IRJ41_007408 [Triplophysa rosa]|uniref:Uncharacterized protein n=1 Tax=Triplophysa rosa TaxID=992332 RepID=A0A9W7X3R7_TRIRA|nr:hypothetical protein IRJ41_007408 [Triplophysa rosa]
MSGALRSGKLITIPFSQRLFHGSILPYNYSLAAWSRVEHYQRPVHMERGGDSQRHSNGVQVHGSRSWWRFGPVGCMEANREQKNDDAPKKPKETNKCGRSAFISESDQTDERLDQLEHERTACVHPYITIQEQNRSKGLVHQITREKSFFILLSGLLSVYFQRAV